MKRKEVHDLKREIEILRAQVKSLSGNQGGFEIMPKHEAKSMSKHVNVEYSSQNLDLLLESGYIRSQLLKTLVFSALSFAIIGGFYFFGLDKVINALNIQI